MFLREVLNLIVFFTVIRAFVEGTTFETSFYYDLNKNTCASFLTSLVIITFSSFKGIRNFVGPHFISFFEPSRYLLEFSG